MKINFVLADAIIANRRIMKEYLACTSYPANGDMAQDEQRFAMGIMEGHMEVLEAVILGDEPYDKDDFDDALVFAGLKKPGDVNGN